MRAKCYIHCVNDGIYDESGCDSLVLTNIFQVGWLPQITADWD